MADIPAKEHSVSSRWNGHALIWTICGEDVTDYDLRRWVANNMQHPVLDVVRAFHIRAYADRAGHCRRCQGRRTILENNLLARRKPCPECAA